MLKSLLVNVSMVLFVVCQAVYTNIVEVGTWLWRTNEQERFQISMQSYLMTRIVL